MMCIVCLGQYLAYKYTVRVSTDLYPWLSVSLLEKFWQISLYVTDDAIAKPYVTEREMVESFVT